MVEPATGEEAGKAVAGGRQQARRSPHQQVEVKGHRARAGQHCHPEQPEEDPEQFVQAQFLVEEQAANQHAHQRGGGVEDRRIAGRQHLRRH